MSTEVTAAPSAPDTTESPAGFWSSTKTVLAVALVLVLVGLAVWLVLDDPDPAGPARPDPGTAAPAAPEAAGEACGPTGGSQIPPVAAPDTDWVLVGAMASPTSDAIGPAETANGVGVCFAPTPAGALFALGTFAAGISSSDARFAAFANLCVDNPGRDVALSTIVAEGDTPDSVGVQIAGYAFSSYVEGESAVIDLVVTRDGRQLHAPFELAWSGTDWDVVLPPTGRPLEQLAVLDSMAGYASWQGA